MSLPIVVLIGTELACAKSRQCCCCVFAGGERGLILHSRVDRSLVCFIHFSWRDACLSWLAASLHFTRHYTRQTVRQFLLSADVLWVDCIGPLLLYTFWVKISLALLFSGQRMLVYQKYCQRVLSPSLSLSPFLISGSLSLPAAAAAAAAIKFSSYMQCICVCLSVWFDGRHRLSIF